MGYICSICDLPIVGEDPHTDPDTGEDVHADCCTACAADGRAQVCT